MTSYFGDECGAVSCVCGLASTAIKELRRHEGDTGQREARSRGRDFSPRPAHCHDSHAGYAVHDASRHAVRFNIFNKLILTSVRAKCRKYLPFGIGII